MNETNPYYAYDYIDNLISNKKENAYLKLIYRIINYYKIKNVIAIGYNTKIDKIATLCHNTKITKVDDTKNIQNLGKFDLVYFAKDTFNNSIHTFNNEQIVIIENLFENYQNFKMVKKREISKIFIDFFDFGIIFAKNNFPKQYYKFYFKNLYK